MFNANQNRDDTTMTSRREDDLHPLMRRTTSRRGRLMRHFTTSTTIHNVVDEPVQAEKVDNRSVLCGLAAGVCQAAVFSPYDRALYLSLTNGTPFLSRENFRTPFSGLSQSIGGRALSGGLYFPLEQFFFQAFQDGTTNTSNKRRSRHHDDDDDDAGRTKNCYVRNFASGTAAGALNAMILNPISAIKYKTWSRMYNQGMIREAIGMLRKGGGGVFYKGLTSTLLRDVTFGGCYTTIRLQIQWANSLPQEHQWTANLIGAALATIVSGPFNLARNIQYSTKSSETAPTTTEVLIQLTNETKAIEGGLQQKGLYLTQRLRIGWGTARVAIGMAFGHWCYDSLHGIVHDDKLWEGKQQQGSI